MDLGVHRRLWDQSPVDAQGQHVLGQSEVICRFLTVQVFGSSNPLVFQQLNVFYALSPRYRVTMLVLLFLESYSVD